MNRAEVFNNNIIATKDFIDKFGYKNLKLKTIHSGLNIGEWRSSQRQKFKKLESKEKREAMLEEFSELPNEFLLKYKISKRDDSIPLVRRKAKIISRKDVRKVNAYRKSVEFVGLYGLDSLIGSTIYKSIEVGVYRSLSIKKFKKLQIGSLESLRMIEEFSDIHPEYLLREMKSEDLNNIDSKEPQTILDALKEYLKDNELESINSYTVYKNFQIGPFFQRRKVGFETLKGEKLNELKRKNAFIWGVIKKNNINWVKRPVISKKTWVHATSDFVKKHGYKNLKQKTMHNDLNIGRWRNSQRAKFKKLKSKKERKAMIEEFKIIHSKFLLPSSSINKKKNISALTDFIKQFGYENLNSSTIHNGLSIGLWLYTQKIKFSKLRTELERESMIREFKSFPKDFLITKKMKEII